MTSTHFSPQPSTNKEKSVGSWWRPVSVIAGLELRQRIRTTRWKATIATIFLLLSLIVFGSLYVAVIAFGGTYADWSVNIYAALLGILLFLGIIFAPTLAATSINGDRKDATLALVQATTISNRQLALGKFLGSWAASCVILVVASPYLIWAIVIAPYGVGPSILGVVVTVTIFGCYSAIGLGISALTARPAGSAVVTQAVVFFLILGLPALFGLFIESTGERHTRIVTTTSYADGEVTGVCREVSNTATYYHTERIWWLLSPNPFLVAADSVAAYDNPAWYEKLNNHLPDLPDASAALEVAGLLSSARSGPYIAPDKDCGTDTSGEFSYQAEMAYSNTYIGQSWYTGLAMNIVLGALGLLIAIRRLRIPAGKLPRGIRIA